MIPAFALTAALVTGVSNAAKSLPHSTAEVDLRVQVTAKPARVNVSPSALPPPDPYGIYDTAQPGSIPLGKNQALYSDGWYAASTADEAGHPRTLWFDVTGNNPWANVLDVEDHDAHWWQAGPWAAEAYKLHPNSPVIIYGATGTWAAEKQSVAEFAPGVPVRWWEAAPSGYPHLLPGSDATQWYWGKLGGYDISETTANFWKPL